MTSFALVDLVLSSELNDLGSTLNGVDNSTLGFALNGSTLSLVLDGLGASALGSALDGIGSSVRDFAFDDSSLGSTHDKTFKTQRSPS